MFNSGSADLPAITTHDYRLFVEGGIRYSYSLSPVDYPADNLYDENNVISWDIAYPELPLIMYVGESLDVSLTAPNINAPVPYIGNSEIVAMDILSSTDESVKVHLTAKAAGMTSITLYSSWGITYPREIWVADSDGKVPHLTGNGAIDDIIELLTSEDITSGSYGNWYDNSSSSTTGSDKSSGLETTDPAAVLEGLSVYPRYALPTDPSEDVYSQTWNKIYNENLSYGAYMFDDDVEVLASRDAVEVFMTLSADLITRNPAQILAVVLPEIDVQTNGIYTFRIPADNITPKGTKIFMHAYDLESQNQYIKIKSAPQGINVVSSHDVTSYTEDYSVLITVDENSAWYIDSDDIYVPEWLKYTIEKTDSNENISVLRITANPDYDNEDGAFIDEVEIGAYNIDNETESTYFGWHMMDPDATGMNYYTDEGTELAYISGDEYINVAVYLDAGTYTPLITAKATSKDISLVKKAAGLDKPVTPPAPPSPPSPPAPPAPSSSGDVTPANPPAPPASDDVNPGGDTQSGDTTGGEVVPESGTPETPTVDLSDTSTTQTIINALRSIVNFITGDTEVVDLADNATVGTERSIDDVSEEELAAIPDGETPAIILPIMRVERPAVYVFGLDLSNLEVGAPIYMHMMAQPDATAAEFTEADTIRDYRSWHWQQ